MKERAEEITERKGLGERELKRGPGRHPRHRVRGAAAAARPRARRTARCARPRPSTRSTSSPTVATSTDADVDRLDRAYQFLRTVEHRIQLYDEQQTHLIPSDEQALVRLARVLGYRDSPERTALERFEAEHREHQRAVSEHPRASLLRAAARDARRHRPPVPPKAAEERLAAFGFTDVERTRAAVRELARRPHPTVAGDAGAAAGDPRMAVGDARPRSRAPATAAAGGGPGPIGVAGGHVPRRARRRRAHVPPARLEPRGRRGAASPPRVRRRPRRRRRARAARRHAPSWSATRSTRSSGAATTSSGARDCAASSAGSCSGSRRAICLGYARLEATERELTVLAEACLEAALGRRCALRYPSPSSGWDASAAASSRTRPTST